MKWVAIPNRSTRSIERKRNAGGPAAKPISVLKRRDELNRCRYRGEDGMKRWVGLGRSRDTLINMGNALAARA